MWSILSENGYPKSRHNMAAALAHLDSETIDVVWLHPRGASLGEIIMNYSHGTDKGPNRVLTQRPATKQHLQRHILTNGMQRAKCEFSYWVGEPIDVFYYPPLTAAEKAASPHREDGKPPRPRTQQNIAADTLMLNFVPNR